MSLHPRWLIAALALALSIAPVRSLDNSLGAWLAQIVLELTFAAAAFALAGRVPWRVATDRLGWRRGRFDRKQQRDAVALCLLLVVASAAFFSGQQEEILSSPGEIFRLPPVAFFLSLALLPPICEEIFFRGAIQGWLTTRAGAPFAIVLTSALFGLMHFGSGSSVVAFATLMGLSLGVLTHFSGSIREAMLVHGVNNFAYFVSQLDGRFS
jgi:membrane protease YdiL (CAAX protease family)